MSGSVITLFVFEGFLKDPGWLVAVCAAITRALVPPFLNTRIDRSGFPTLSKRFGVKKNVGVVRCYTYFGLSDDISFLMQRFWRQEITRTAAPFAFRVYKYLTSFAKT